MTHRFRPYLISISDAAGQVHEPTKADIAAEAAVRLHHVMDRCGANALRARAYVLSQMEHMAGTFASQDPVPADFRSDRHWPRLPTQD